MASPESALGSIQPLPARNRQNTPLFTLLPPFHHVRVAGLDPFSPRRNRLFAASSTAGLARISSKASAERTLLTLDGLAFSEPATRPTRNASSILMSMTHLPMLRVSGFIHEHVNMLNMYVVHMCSMSTHSSRACVTVVGGAVRSSG